ncbi:pirin family protein [Neolewinella lacunae]|uniref:Pirin family protein n=1 Tax=Neolewinella lacunae TaxID=1517758 RepID=A0A923PMI0_9BACT|nr:pirin family protein [Neolewinella lacunae]MBC6995165.1 pirin family protein [Neolewinella lacunae]MDN3634115.1 pirin family protein [Neolewinella lacunae]
MPNQVLSTFPLGMPWQTFDPFLFSVHHLDRFPAGNEALGPAEGTAGRRLGQDFGGKDGWNMYHGQTVPGFPYHPHKGFETITVVERGFADHTDSLGATGRFGGGDVQWMTAGKGVLHSEMFPLLNPEGDNTMELFQIWLNLPRANKLVPPNYQMLWAEDIPIARFPGVEVKVIAGEVDGHAAPAPPPHSWAADPNNHLAVWLLRLNAGAEWTLPAAPADLNRTLYFFRGEQLSVAGQAISPYHGVRVASDAALPLVAGDTEVSLLLLQARPIGEPVAQHGPFVMNTQEEIALAFAEYRKTQFGGWPWPSEEYVHPREKGRFALYPDGREEVR